MCGRGVASRHSTLAFGDRFYWRFIDHMGRLFFLQVNLYWFSQRTQLINKALHQLRRESACRQMVRTTEHALNLQHERHGQDGFTRFSATCSMSAADAPFALRSAATMALVSITSLSSIVPAIASTQVGFALMPTA